MVFQPTSARILLSVHSARSMKGLSAARRQFADSHWIMENHSCDHALQGVQVKLETSPASKFPLKSVKTKITFRDASLPSGIAV